MVKTLAVFFEKNMQLGNCIVNGEIKTDEDITLLKKEIKKEFGHDPKTTVILNLITLYD